MMHRFEEALRKQHYDSIAGCDEVGRGPLAGPVVCAAVVLDPKYPIEGIYDSKGLSEKRRNQLYEAIIEHALAYKVVFIDHHDVDTLNVYQASKKGMIEAIQALDYPVDYVLSDAMPLTGLKIPYEAIIKGDQKSVSIAAASILAKVERDRYMQEAAKMYPEYGFEKHKGYPTKEHLKALKTYGPCPIHRKSFNPVKAFYEIQQSFEV